MYPYSPHKAEGYALFTVSHIIMHPDLHALLYENYCNLQAVDRGRLLESDVYFDHIELVENPLKVLLITNK